MNANTLVLHQWHESTVSSFIVFFFNIAYCIFLFGQSHGLTPSSEDLRIDSQPTGKGLFFSDPLESVCVPGVRMLDMREPLLHPNWQRWFSEVGKNGQTTSYVFHSTQVCGGRFTVSPVQPGPHTLRFCWVWTTRVRSYQNNTKSISATKRHGERAPETP